MTSSESRVMPVTVDDVWSILKDGWLFSTWVVGAVQVRDVDVTWPEEKSAIHHSIGLWPLMINDDTFVLSSEPRGHLELRARGWPLGEAQVRISLEAVPDGTKVTMTESVVKGPAQLIPVPVRNLLIGARNRECLLRLEYLARGRAAN